MNLFKLIEDSSLSTIRNLNKDALKKGLAELDSSGKNAIHLAAEHGENKILEFMLNEEIELSKILSSKDKLNQWTPLINAMRNQQISKRCLDTMVAKGGLEVGIDSQGNTLAHHLAWCENDAFISEVWTKSKADWSVVNKKGETPLMILLARDKKGLILKMAEKEPELIKNLLGNEKFSEYIIQNPSLLPTYYQILNKLRVKLPEVSEDRLSKMYKEAYNLIQAADFLSNPAGYNRKVLGGKSLSFIISMILIFAQPWLQGYYYIWIGGPMEIPKTTPKILKATNPSKVMCENRNFFSSSCPNDGHIYDNYLIDQRIIEKYIQMDTQNKPQNRGEFVMPNTPPPPQDFKDMPGGFQGFPSWRGQDSGDLKNKPPPNQWGMPQNQGFPSQGFQQQGRGPSANQGFPQGQPPPGFRPGMPSSNQGRNQPPPGQFRQNPNQGGNPNMRNPGNSRPNPSGGPQGNRQQPNRGGRN